MGSEPVRSWMSSASTRGSSTLSRMVRPGVDMDGDAVRAKRDRLVFIKKTVDRHTLFFEFLDQAADGLRRDIGVGKIVAQVQLIPGQTPPPKTHKVARTARRPAAPALRRQMMTLRLVRYSSTRSTRTLPKAAQNCWSAVNCGQTWVTKGFKMTPLQTEGGCPVSAGFPAGGCGRAALAGAAFEPQDAHRQKTPGLPAG